MTGRSKALAPTNDSIKPHRRAAIAAFHHFVLLPEIAHTIDEMAQELLRQISPEKPLAFAELRFGELNVRPPEGVGTIRIAVFYPGCETGVERHPNSTQFLFSVRGIGETRVLRGEEWEIDRYGTITDAARLEERWHVVEMGVWHHSVAMGQEPWILAALHSADRVEDEYQK